MANRDALRAFQSRLASRLQAARTTGVAATWLAVEAGEGKYLFPLGHAGEIFPWTPPQPVPYTEPWFLGVANLRGHLHGVVDLAGFLGVKTVESGREQSRLVGFNQALELNCVLMVDRLSGLRSESDLTRDDDEAGERPSFVGGRYRDAASRVWQELSLVELAGNDLFLRIVG